MREPCPCATEDYERDPRASGRVLVPTSANCSEHNQLHPNYSRRWSGHGDLIRNQLQSTGRVRLSFLTLADLYTACDDLGIDPRQVEFKFGYACLSAAVPESSDREADLREWRENRAG